jgi:hypothetical protein
VKSQREENVFLVTILASNALLIFVWMQHSHRLFQNRNTLLSEHSGVGGISTRTRSHSHSSVRDSVARKQF